MSQVRLTRRFETEGFTLAWDEWGSAPGPPLVLLHGFSGSAHDFAGHIEALALDRRVLAIDHRGHGRSSNSLDEMTYTLDHIVDDTIGWLDAEVGGPVDLLGHSMGGRVALRLALARRDLLRSLILMDTTAWTFGPADPAVTEMVIDYFESLGPESTMGSSPETPESLLIDAATSAEWQATKAELNAAFDPMAAKAIGLALFKDQLLPVGHLLGDIDIPVTVIVGENDRPLVEHAPELAGGVVDGELAVIAGAYHSPQLTQPAQWRAAVEAHLVRAAAR